ncbi:MAG TPA: VOC family protein [Solirubrobacterales bacterium]|nr:VOC family protein [Solirubrobacterales bacterium]
MSTTTSTTTVTNLAAVIIPVRDQDRMVEFYTEALGLEKRADIPFGDEEMGRWVEVVPSGGETPIALCPPGPDREAEGTETGISLRTDDIEAYHAQLRERGVDVDEEVSRMGEPVPPLFWFRDPEGNTLMVVETTD